MWQLRGGVRSLTETPFCRIKSVKWLWESGEGSWICLAAEELSGKHLSFSCQGWIFFFFFFLSFLCFIAEALTRHSLFLIFQSQFSLLSVLRSLSSTPFLLYLLVFSYFGQITLSSSAPTLMFISFFSITQLQTETDGQALRPRWNETGSHSEI